MSLITIKAPCDREEAITNKPLLLQNLSLLTQTIEKLSSTLKITRNQRVFPAFDFALCHFQPPFR